MFANKFPGRCVTCGTNVSAGAGLTDKVGGKYVTWCAAHDPTVGQEAPPDLSRARVVYGQGAQPVTSAPLPPLAATLTEEQLAVVRFGPDEAVVAASAGSGKTFVLAQRVLYGLHTGATPERMVVLAFNKRAASEFRERLVSIVGPGLGGRIPVMTFHAWAYQLLRAWYPGAAWLQSDRILDVGSMPKEPVVKAALAAIGHKDVSAADVDGWARIAGRVSDDLIDPESPSARAAIAKLLDVEGAAEEIREFCLAYREAKRARGRIDFNDMLYLVARAIQTRTGHGIALGTLYDHVMQDEAQDGSKARWLILDGLFAKGMGKTLVSVGDVRQSINGFAGARPDLLRQRITNGAKLLTLSVNWRSAAAMVDLGNKVAEGRDWNLGGAASAAPTAKPGILDVWWDDTRTHSEIVVADILEGLQRDPALTVDGRPRYAVLTRTRTVLAGFELRLAQAGIPARVIGGSAGFWGSPIGRDVLAYVQLCAAGECSLDLLRRAANTPKRYLRREIVEQVHGAVQGRTADLARALRATFNDGARTFAEDIEYLHTLPWPEQCDQIKVWLTSAYEAPPEGKDIQGQIDADDRREMAGMLCDLASTLPGAEPLLDVVTQMERGDKAAGQGEMAPAVLLSTIHTFKGLEAHTVYGPYCVDKYLPHARASGSAAIEEERRLFYVLVTRARERLVLTPAGGEPSPFLADAGLFPPEEAEEAPEAGETPGGAVEAEEPEEAPPTAQAPVEPAGAPPAPAPVPRPESMGAWRQFEVPEAAVLWAAEQTAEMPSTVGTGPGSRYVEVGVADLRALLVDNMGYTMALAAGQRVFDSPDRDGVFVRVYSSIDPHGVVARDVGEDSIKVVALCRGGTLGERPVLPKDTYCCRTRGWRNTLLARIRSAYEALRDVPTCPECGAPLRLRSGKRGPFYGCVTYPVCQGTLDVADWAPRAPAPPVAAEVAADDNIDPVTGAAFEVPF